jgi:hypothetical protein
MHVRDQRPAGAAEKPVAPGKPGSRPAPVQTHKCPGDSLALSRARQDAKVVSESLKRQAAAAKTPAEAMDVFDRAHEKGLKEAATAALKRAIDLCQNQRDGLQVAKTADFLGYKEAAEYAYKVVEGLPASEDFPF